MQLPSVHLIASWKKVVVVYMLYLMSLMRAHSAQNQSLKLSSHPSVLQEDQLDQLSLFLSALKLQLHQTWHKSVKNVLIFY